MLRINRILPFFLRGSQSNSKQPSCVHTYYKRRFGVFSSVKDKVASFVEKKKEVRSEDTFQQSVDLLLSYREFNVDDYYHLQLEIGKKTGVSGWRSFIPGAGKDQSAADNKLAVSILSQLSSERRTLDILNVPLHLKQRISKNSNSNLDDVNIVFKQYFAARMMHKCLQTMKDSGISPKTPEEFENQMRVHPPKLDKKLKQMATRYNGKKTPNLKQANR